MTFYVNQVYGLPESDWDHKCIGLFDKRTWKGEGNFCGWYGVELYCDTTLLAYGIQNISGGEPYNPKLPFDGGFYPNVNKYYDQIPIGSGIWEKIIEAENVEEAIEKFRKADY